MGVQGESLWDLKNKVFSCQENSKSQVRDLGPGQRPLCVVGVRPGVIEGSSRKTGPEMGVGCVRPAWRLDLDLPIPSCQSGFLEPAWGKVIFISPKVVLTRVIHWVNKVALWATPPPLLRPQGLKGLSTLVGKTRPDQTSQKRGAGWTAG